jgi:hypothetical protein
MQLANECWRWEWHTHQLFWQSGRIIAPVYRSCVSYKYQVDFDKKQIVSVSPLRNPIKDLMKECGIELIINLCEELKEVEDVHLACNKGNKGNDNLFCKYLTWWNPTSKKVDKVFLDVDSAGGSSEDAAQSIDPSLQTIDVGGGKGMLTDGSTYAGGGGTFSGFGDGGSFAARELHKLEQLQPVYFIVSTCSCSSC